MDVLILFGMIIMITTLGILSSSEPHRKALSLWFVELFFRWARFWFAVAHAVDAAFAAFHIEHQAYVIETRYRQVLYPEDQCVQQREVNHAS